MLVLAFRALSSQELEKLKSSGASGAIIYAANQKVRKQLGEAGIDCSIVNDALLKSASSELTTRILKFGHVQPTSAHELALEATAYRGEFYPWHLTRRLLYWACEQAFSEYFILNKLKKEHAPSTEVLVFSGSDLFKRISLNGVDYRESLQPVSKRKKGGKSKINYVLMILVRSMLGIFKPVKRDKHIFLNNVVRFHELIGLDGRSRIKDDPIFSYLHNELGKSNQFFHLQVLKQFGASAFGTFSEAIWPRPNIRNYGYFESQVMLGFFNPWRLARLLDYRKKLVRYCRNTPTFKDEFDQYIFSKVKQLTSQLMVSAARYDLSLSLFRRIKPITVGGDNELTFVKYPMICAARKLGIPTYGIQHGGISMQNIDYSFTEKDRAHHPYPDLTMVWGEDAIERLCTHSAYPPEKLKLVGQVRTDVIPVLRAVDRSSLLKNYTPGQKVVVFAGQSLPKMPEMRQRLARDIVRLYQDLQNVRLIIKPHPNELKDMSLYHELAAELDVEIDISTDDLYVLISACDAVITFYSTVGAEAIYFGKALLLLDYDGMDGAGYIKQQVGYHCASYDELKWHIERLSANELPAELPAHKDYLKRKVYKIDGNSRFRVIKAIEELAMA